jgi:hypothetical protein
VRALTRARLCAHLVEKHEPLDRKARAECDTLRLGLALASADNVVNARNAELRRAAAASRRNMRCTKPRRLPRFTSESASRARGFSLRRVKSRRTSRRDMAEIDGMGMATAAAATGAGAAATAAAAAAATMRGRARGRRL